MKLSQAHSYAIQARLAGVVGAEIFDRLFAGAHFDATEAPLLYVYVKDDDLAEEVADEFAYVILVIASGILKRRIHTVVVLPSIFIDD
jgi:hypothetical protein